MRISSTVVASLAAVAALGMWASPSTAAPTVPAAHAVAAGVPATVRVVVRPVTVSHKPAVGFTVANEPDSTIDCNFADPSLGGVNPNIESCSPSAAYVPACWKAASPGYALCLRDPSVKKLARIPLSSTFAPTAPISAAKRSPLLLVLLDGTKCNLRIGGAAGMYPGHPNLYTSYYCDHHGVVWAGNTAPHSGVVEAAASWTVRTADGNSPLVVRHVKKAFFVGTLS